MRYAMLGKTEIEVSVIAFGGHAIGGGPGFEPPPEDEAEATVRAAWDGGINFFVTGDTEGDGRAERIIGRALGADRSRAVIATRTGPEHHTATELPLAVERSLKNLGTTWIDLYLLDGVPRLPVAEVLGQLAAIRKEGKIRAFGVALHGPESLAKAAAVASSAPSCAMAPYSLLFRAAEEGLLPACAKHGIPLIASAPLMFGLLAGRFELADDVPPERALTRHFAAGRGGAKHGGEGCESETFQAIAAIRTIAAELEEPLSNVSLAWVLAHKEVVSAVVGARLPLHAKRNARAGNLMLPYGAVDRLTKATETLKKKLGPSIDLWQEPGRYP